MSSINSQNNLRSVELAQNIIRNVVQPLNVERDRLSQLQKMYQSTMGTADVSIAERLAAADARFERLFHGIDAFMARLREPLPTVVSPMQVIEAPDAASKEQFVQQRASVEQYVAEEFPGLCGAARSEGALDTGTELHVQVDRAQRLDDLEQTLAESIYLHSNGSVYRLSQPQKDAMFTLVASAMIQANCEEVDDARRGCVTSPNTITRALLSFGGDVRAYDKALLHARNNGCLRNAEGRTRRSYVVNRYLLEAFRDGSLTNDTASARWPTLSRIASLCDQVESRDIDVVLQNPTPEQVERTIASITQRSATDPVLKTALRHLLDLHLSTTGEAPSFSSAQLVPQDSGSAPGNEIFAKRELQRLGLTSHITHMRSGESLTQLGLKVLDDAQIFNLLCEGIDQIQNAPIATEEVGVSAVGPATPSVYEGVAADEVEWGDVVTELVSLTGEGREAIDMDSLRKRGVSPEEIMGRLAALKETYGGQTVSVETVLELVSSPSFWKRISMPHTGADRGNGPSDAKDLTLAGFEKLKADIAAIARKYSHSYPKLADAEAIAELIVEGFIFHGSPLIGRNKRPEHEVMRTFRKGKVVPECRDRMERVLQDLISAGCVLSSSSKQGKYALSLNVDHPFVAEIAPLLQGLRGAAGTSPR